MRIVGIRPVQFKDSAGSIHPLKGTGRTKLSTPDVEPKPETELTTRPVEPRDLDLICEHRKRMFAEAGRPTEELIPMAENFRLWLEPRLADGRYFGFLLEDAGQVIAGVGLILLDFPPHFLHPTSSARGYILNVFVEPSHRGRGLATRLMELSEAEFARRGVEFLVLHASDMGRPVYEKMGWFNMPEMAKKP
jgi:GNAT superfamily N-acetyltransferase